MTLLFILSVGCTPFRFNDGAIYPENESTATNIEISEPNEAIFTPTIVPTMVDAPMEMMVPYTKSSIWNTPIGPSPKYDPHSDEMIAMLVLAHHGKIITAGDNIIIQSILLVQIRLDGIFPVQYTGV